MESLKLVLGSGMNTAGAIISFLDGESEEAMGFVQSLSLKANTNSQTVSLEVELIDPAVWDLCDLPQRTERRSEIARIAGRFEKFGATVKYRR